MSAPGGVEVVLAALQDAAAPLAAAEGELETCGDALAAAATTAAGAAGEGPLAGALGEFGREARDRTRERGDECRELSQALLESAEEYRASDAAAAGRLDGVSFGGVTG